MSAPTSATSELPSRTFTNQSVSDSPLPDEDTSELTRLFSERLSAWKHAVAYLEDYITATEKANHSQGKEYEKVLKTVKDPLKEAHHFDQSLGGIAGFFENIRSNTQGLSNQHFDTAKQLKGAVLPVFDRLHTEIRNKSKELTKGAGKASKVVDKARAATQKHIELLGQKSATYSSHGGDLKATEDPYVVQRGIMYRLNKQIQEENANRQDVISIQNSFAQFEAHIIQTIQAGMVEFQKVMNIQGDHVRSSYGDMVATAQRVPLDFEWNGFIRRNTNILIDPSAPARTISQATFPNQNHASTQPLIAGSLERKGKIMGSYSTNYYVVSPSKFLHEFKTDDNYAKEPVPELSLYLPDCMIGAVSGNKFNVKGKDASKGKIGGALAMSHELKFKAHTPSAANQWWEVIRHVAGTVTTEVPEASVPNSPVTDTHTAGTFQPLAAGDKNPAPVQTEGLQKEGTATKDHATPASATAPGSATTPASATAPGSAAPTKP